MEQALIDVHFDTVDKKEKKYKPILTHFINIPIEDASFIKSYETIRDELHKADLKNFYPELLQKHYKLHMTILALDLADENKLEKVHTILSKICEEIRIIVKGDLKFNFEKYDTMGNLTTARVIYAKMMEDENYQKLTDIIHLIIKTLLDAEVLSRRDLKESHVEYDKKTGRYGIKLHMTLLNVTFLNRKNKGKKTKKFYKIDATDIIEFLKVRHLPTADLNNINLSKMKADKITGKYELVYS